MKGNIIRLPSDKESERAEQGGRKPFFPRVGRYFTNRDGKTMFSLDIIPDAMFMLSEDKPKEKQEEMY